MLQYLTEFGSTNFFLHYYLLKDVEKGTDEQPDEKYMCIFQNNPEDRSFCLYGVDTSATPHMDMFLFQFRGFSYPIR